MLPYPSFEKPRTVAQQGGARPQRIGRKEGRVVVVMSAKGGGNGPQNQLRAVYACKCVFALSLQVVDVRQTLAHNAVDPSARTATYP